MKYPCSCCGYKTINSDGDYEICPICFWEDDPFQKVNIDEEGANKISLVEAQINYFRLGVSEERFIHNVRKSKIEDKRNPDWKPIKESLWRLL
ncbi:CPCC family cysteine-rich protein [Lysinibacillus sp. RC79]|uniref:CPCC family cysteine-rich protein n=1 Tax=Lysinibacillus sp. RC79 TaxID=3156296 RepID=UPI0035181232